MGDLRELRELLANLCPNETRARRLVADAGLDQARFPFAGSAIDMWFGILDEAERQGAVEKLIAAAERDFPERVAPVLFSWLHLSDLHFGYPGPRDRWDQRLVLQTLRADITLARADGAPAPGAILVTGDVAYAGKASEYAEAERWLASVAADLGLGREHVFVVPGNHDLDRDAGASDARAAVTLAALRAGTDDLDTALARPDDRVGLERRFAAFATFARGFAPGCLPHGGGPAAGWLAWRHALPARAGDPTVYLAGLNTALLAADGTDHAKLRLPREALAEALAIPTKLNVLVLALGHHPLAGGWLAAERDTSRWIAGRARVYLSGHVHEPGIEATAGGAGDPFVRVSAGASHGGAAASDVPVGHGYNIAALVRRPGATASGAGLALRVWPRRWAPDRSMRFAADTDHTQPGSAFSEHVLG